MPMQQPFEFAPVPTPTPFRVRTWDEITQDPAFLALPTEHREEVRAEYVRQTGRPALDAQRRRIPPPRNLTVPPSVIKQWPTGDRLLAPQLPDMDQLRPDEGWRRVPPSRARQASTSTLTDTRIMGMSDQELDDALAARSVEEQVRPQFKDLYDRLDQLRRI